MMEVYGLFRLEQIPALIAPVVLPSQHVQSQPRVRFPAYCSPGAFLPVVSKRGVIGTVIAGNLDEPGNGRSAGME